ncbi:Iron-sulfur cluster co-chaperone protein HscB [Carex littledalei]|uniref:Iron-sulfur cluster co-chaperone protein HscB n=1 Tax=Carex littledalei TaxID=544730 RepID=A0A833QFC5_9POAL|nr:Iron-sulfur cluster co-chaperone protein HscB [Carex littledalei]
MWSQRNRFLLSSLSHLRHVSSTSPLSHLRPLKPSPCLYPYNSFLPPIDSQGRNHLLDLPAGTISRNLTSSNSCSSCWNCGTVGPKSGPFLACGSCGAVQPVDTSVDYFHIFGIKKIYEIKEEDLEGIYKNWQKKLHPDLVHSKSEKEKAFAAEQSARVIDAYRTLKKPLSRALYLLKLEGVHVDEEKTVSDPELLIEMMEMREAVEDAKDSKSLYEIQSQVKKKLEAWSKSFKEAFYKRDFDSAINCTQRMRYYDRALEEITKKL